MRKFLLLVFPITLLGLCPFARAQSTAADLRGVYLYTNNLEQIAAPNLKQLSTAIKLPGVDGVAIVIGWAAIEPAIGQYDWSLLDDWIAQSVAAGLKIDLVVAAGSSTPSWLFLPAPKGAAAQQLTFTVSPHDGATGKCDSDITAKPWDPAFLTQWDAMLAALAAHLKSAGTYNAITLLRLTGINRTTEELRLPAETPQGSGLTCVTDALALWQQAGYRPSLLLQGWNSILASFAKSFPDKYFGVSLITANAFPAIGEDGSLLTGAAASVDRSAPLITLASQKLPARLIVQFDFLMPGEAPSPQVINYAQTLGTLVAWQTNEYFGPLGSACSEHCPALPGSTPHAHQRGRSDGSHR